MPIPDSLWQEIERISAGYPFRQGAVLPVLHRVQAEQGYLAEETLSELAEYLRMPQVDLFEIATFYTLLHTAEQGQNIILACNNISCYLLEAESVLATIEDELKIKPGETSADKKFSLQAVSCLGACDRGPVMLINDKLYTHLTPEKVRRILSRY